MGARVVALFGPTASGKSGAAIALAAHTGGEIVSCDAMQLYRELPVLTNQPTTDELAAAPHHLVGVWELEHEGSVAEYASMAHAAVDGVLERGRLPIVVGGSGLYLRAALAAMNLPPEPPAGLRTQIERRYDELGAAAAHAELVRRDPAAAAAVHPKDRRRVVRALELAELGSSLAPAQDELWSPQARHETAVYGLDVPRELVAARIADRTAAMFEHGVEDEVRTALAAHTLSHTASRIHGLQDVSALVHGEIDRAEARRRLIVRTRQYAKRQRVWMRKLPGLIPVGSADELLEAV
ncbi:MAG TPA: tRNA (adenosine(37)-N6)-dimethylallyltransferase MiaA [Gaiellales bacterium]|nr:tRNA (adenosine(37)-N6)-dimethylallyltransferase MiaA [Gaiellales bacterium]